MHFQQTLRQRFFSQVTPSRARAVPYRYAATLGALLFFAPSHIAHGHSVVTVLHTFSDGSVTKNVNGFSVYDGYGGSPGLTQGNNGIYGVSYLGGDGSKGTIFRRRPAGDYTILHSFSSGAALGELGYPQTSVTLGSDGNFYGTAQGDVDVYGSVFQITPTGVMKTLHLFDDGSVVNDAHTPNSPLVEATPGVFYGMTALGGINDRGAIYQITAAGDYSLLHNFGDNSTPHDGDQPFGQLLRASDGGFYGTTYSGGTANEGIAFKFTPPGAYRVIHQFYDGSVVNDGAVPQAGLMEGIDGYLYGTTYYGGSANKGCIFKMSKSGTTTILHSFADNSQASDGLHPKMQLMQDSGGTIYGTTELGGLNNLGVIFAINPDGVYSIKHNFSLKSPEGHTPTGGLLRGSDGNLYGATAGGAANFGALYTISFLPDPTLTQIAPTVVQAGHVSFNLTVAGSNFFPGASVYLNGKAIPTTIISSSQLNATVYKEYVANAGPASITVGYKLETPTPALPLTITPGVAVTSLFPNSALQEQNDCLFAVNGTGFGPDAIVSFNGANLKTTYVTPSQLTAIAPRGYLVTPGTVSVTVRRANIGPATPLPFTITRTSRFPRCAPSSIQAGHKSFSVSIVGAGFSTSTKAYWNGALLPTYFVSSGQIVASVPAAYVAAPTTASITVTPTTSANDPISFPVTAALTLTSISPSSVSAGSPDFTLTATGTDFVIGAAITWNGSALTTTYVSPTQLTATVPAASIASSGSAAVRVTNPGVAPTAPLTVTIAP